MTTESDDVQLWRIQVIDQSFADGEMTEDEVIEALLETLELNTEQPFNAELEQRLRDFQANRNKMQSPLIAALLCGDTLFDKFLRWKDGHGIDNEPEIAQEPAGAEPPEGNIFTDSYDSEGNMLPPWQVFPDSPMTSIQWRLGSGASYLTVFGAWFQGLEPPAQQQYIEKYPVPESFRELYLFRDLL